MDVLNDDCIYEILDNIHPDTYWKTLLNTRITSLRFKNIFDKLILQKHCFDHDIRDENILFHDKIQKICLMLPEDGYVVGFKYNVKLSELLRYKNLREVLVIGISPIINDLKDILHLNKLKIWIDVSYKCSLELNKLAIDHFIIEDLIHRQIGYPDNIKHLTLKNSYSNIPKRIRHSILILDIENAYYEMPFNNMNYFENLRVIRFMQADYIIARDFSKLKLDVLLIESIYEEEFQLDFPTGLVHLVLSNIHISESYVKNIKDEKNLKNVTIHHINFDDVETKTILKQIGYNITL